MSTETEKTEEILISMLARTTDWLKFGEAKNAALLTFSSAWLLAIGNLAFGPNRIPDQTRLAIGWAAPFIFIGAMLAIIAILPKVSLFRKKRSGVINYLFYGNLSKHTGEDIVTEVRDAYIAHSADGRSEQYLKHLGEQVSELSAVTLRKYRLFSFGAFSILVSLITFFGLAYGRGFISFFARTFFAC